jgi:histidine triad (HIT) family protein
LFVFSNYYNFFINKKYIFRYLFLIYLIDEIFKKHYYLNVLCRDGEIGRRTGLKIPRWRHCVGSSPTPGTINKLIAMNANCIFCQIVSQYLPVNILEQSEFTIVIADINPQASIHELIIPKKHLCNLLDVDHSDQLILGDMLFMAKKRSIFHQNCDFKAVINNGAGVGQTVFHLHMHFLAGKITQFP